MFVLATPAVLLLVVTWRSSELAHVLLGQKAEFFLVLFLFGLWRYSVTVWVAVLLTAVVVWERAW
jgi:hypothetical protein